MKIILPRYLLKELFKTFVPAFCGFGALILLGLTIQLLHKGLDIVDIRAIVPYLMLYACPDVLPISFLAATVMTYGKFSTNNEIVAIRTSGLHLNVIITPVIIIGLLLSFLTFYLNAEVLPRSNGRIKLLKETAINSVLTKHISAVKKKVVFEPYHIYIGETEGNVYKKLAIIEYVKDFVTNILLAEEGMIVMSDDGNSIILSLKNGDFAKMNYQKPTEVPRVGSFDEMSFEIPINKKDSTTSKKYKTLVQLFEDRASLDAELEMFIETLNTGNEEEFAKSLKRKLNLYQQNIKTLNSKYNNTVKQVADLSESINKNKAELQRMKNESHTYGNQAAVANIKLEQLKRDVEDNQADVQGEINEQEENIQRYLHMQKSLKKEFVTISDLIGPEEEELVGLKSKAAELEQQIIELEKNGTQLKGFAKIKKLRKESNEYSVLIHKRLSSSLLCLTFVLIGIPIGILTKSGNVLINFGISFLVVILVYYPLSVVGVILSKGTLPIIPAIWGPNGVIVILGIVLFRKSLSK